VDGLGTLITRVDLLDPGVRADERGSADLVVLVRSFNEMLDRGLRQPVLVISDGAKGGIKMVAVGTERQSEEIALMGIFGETVIGKVG